MGADGESAPFCRNEVPWLLVLNGLDNVPAQSAGSRSANSLTAVRILLDRLLPAARRFGAYRRLLRGDGHDRRSGTFARLPGKLDVTPFLADLCEACRFQLAFDFTIG